MSQQFPGVPCPLCKYPNLWRGAKTCPVCGGGKVISRFKLPGVYVLYPELSRVDTERELEAVKEPSE